MLLPLIFIVLLGARPTPQETPPAPEAQAPDLDPDARDGVAALQEYTRLESLANADQNALEVIAKDLELSLEQLAVPLPPKPVAIGEIGPEDVEQLERVLEESRVFLAAWRKGEVLRTRTAELIETGEELAVKARTSPEDWMQRADSLRSTLHELQRRVAGGELTEESLGLKLGVVDATMQRLTDALAQREEKLAEIDGLIVRFQDARDQFQALPALDQDSARFAERISLALRTIGEAIAAQSELIARLEAAPVETLPTEVERIWLEWAARRATMVTAAENFVVVSTAFDDLLRVRTERVVPTAGELQEGDEPIEVRRARRDVSVSERLIEYYQGDLTLLAELAESRTALLGAGAEATTRHGDISRQTARILAARRVLEARLEDGTLVDWEAPEGLDAGEIWDTWRAMQTEEADRAEAVQRAQGPDLGDGTRKSNEARILAEQKTLRVARTRLETELSHAEFVATMEERTGEELLTLLAPDSGVELELQRLDGELAALADSIAAAELACRETIVELRRIESPYSRRILKNRRDRQADLEELLNELAEGEILEKNRTFTVPSGADFPPDDEMPWPPEPSRAEPLEIAEQEQRHINSQQVFTRILLSYYQRLDSAHDELEQRLGTRRELGDQREGLLEQRLRQFKMRYAAACEVLDQLDADEIESGIAREMLEQWATTRDVVIANEALREWRRRNADFIDPGEYSVQRLEVVSGLEPAVELASTSADKRAHMIGTPVSRLLSALTSVEDLKDVHQKTLAFQAEVRRAEEESFFERAVKRFTSSKVLARFEEPLTAYHLELANLDRVIEDLIAAEESYGRIADSWESDAEKLRVWSGQADAVLAQRVFDYQSARYAAAAAAHPGSTERIEQAFREAHGAELPQRLDALGGDLGEAAGVLFGAEMRLTAQRVMNTRFTLLLSKVGIEVEVNWYREQMARVRSMLERARNDRDGLRITIEDLRAQYHERLMDNAIFGSIVTVCIPIFAWLLVWGVRRGAKRYEYEYVGELGEQASDRKRRMRTLARTLTATLTGVIWGVAAIYVFAQLGLDITPIVASASVLGLAVAFGAQSLIKDFLYGFYILMENQFTVGDIVELGTISGTVEKISLRITILRDLKGVVHYIPNGSITQVSNKTQGWARVVFEVSVPYDENPDHASEVLQSALNEFYEDPAWRPRMLEEPVIAGVQNLTERSIDIRLMIKVRPGKQWEVEREARRRIKLRLDKAGIQSPFPHSFVHHIQEPDGGRAE